MNRASQVVKILAENGLIAPKGPKLLIVGGGIAGVTAALAANDLGIGSLIQEVRPEIFSVQIDCPTRHIYPHLYRWPTAGWRAKEFVPSQDARHQLAWEDGLCKPVGKQLLAKFKQLQAESLGAIVVKRSAKSFTTMENLKQMCAPFRDHDGYLNFGALLFALGPFRERYFHEYDGQRVESPPFWSDDDYETARPHPTDVSLVSGAGDGALQDMIRLATGGPIREFAEALFPRNDVQAKQWTKSLAEDLTDPRDCFKTVKKHLDNTRPGLLKKWFALLDETLRPPLPRLIVLGDSFARCFPLNAFMVLLIGKWSELPGHEPCLLYNSKIVSVTKDAAGNCKSAKIETNGHPSVVQCSRLVIRHGLNLFK